MKAKRILATSGAALVALSLAAQAQTQKELAGNSLTAFPHFEFVRAINEGSPMRLAVDPGTTPALVGQTADLYVVAHKTITQWTSTPGLVDLTGAVETVNFVAGTIQMNTFIIDPGSLSGNAGIGLGVPYDVVVDVDQNGQLNAGDYIDGYNDNVAGVYVVADTTDPGPLAVTELTYDLSGAAWDEQNTFYPTSVATMGQLPLIVVSHGNGHNYQWYDHIGTHMASRGYVVMSHANNTGPGVASAATTTLSNTEAFLNNLGTIGGGALLNHVDADNIVWIGHSRGGEGVVIAYDRLFDGSAVPVPTKYALSDIKLISSIAPTDFLVLPSTDPHAANYHLWTGASDSDVNGCASCDLCQTYHLHDRAQQYRQQITLQGVGHGWFHNGGGNPWATGPCQVGMPDTHLIVKGYLFPLVERYIHGNVPAKDFLTRQYESFHPIGAPVANPCAVVTMTYRDGSLPANLVIDNYQTNPSTTVASSGIKVASTVAGVTEGHLDDANGDFSDVGAADLMNGMTVNGNGTDDSAGVVFEWNGGNNYYAFVVSAGGPINFWKSLSFRAAQSTRDAFTTASLGDLTFDVTLADRFGVKSSINISAFGGGVEEPYQRTGCGLGAGWANEFETIRIPIEAFAYNGSGIDLSRVVAVAFEFGPGHGSAQGRIGIDDVELLVD